jgi:tetratricopeptide (TPR) repeat protein
MIAGVLRPRLGLAVGLAVLLSGGAPPHPSLAQLIDALAKAPAPAQAAVLEQQIYAAWHAALTPAVQLLAEHATDSALRGHTSEALADLNAALLLQPDSADLWRIRGEVRLQSGDESGAAADLAQALSREARCFPALADFSRLAESLHKNKRALAVWQAFLKIDPQAPGGVERLKTLQRKVFGQPT